MDLGGIIGDAVRYPFSDWKKILIYGILTMISSLGIATLVIGTILGIRNIVEIILLFIIGYIICGFLINGYKFRIIKTSLNGVAELPEFNNWIEMFIDGIKVSIVVIVYLIPAILIIAFAGLCLSYYRDFRIKSISNQLQYNFKYFKCNSSDFYCIFLRTHNSPNKLYGNSIYGRQ